MKEYESILFEVEGGVAVISLNTPANFNAMTEELVAELSDALNRCADDDGIRVVVIRGEGKAFCAGGDIRSMKRGLDEGDAHMLTRIVRALGDVARRIRMLQKPVVAEIHGSAAGAGCSLALLCDFRIVSEEVRFIEAFVGVGLVPDTDGVHILSRYVGLGRLTEYLMTGKPLTAQEALEMGVVNRVATRENLHAEAMSFAEKLKLLPAKAVGLTKALINQTLFADMGLCLERETEYQDILSQSADHAEGVAAFLEKRPPRFGER